MLSSVTLHCQITTIVMTWDYQWSEMCSCSQSFTRCICQCYQYLLDISQIDIGGYRAAWATGWTMTSSNEGAWQNQNGWFFGKVPDDSCPPSKFLEKKMEIVGKRLTFAKHNLWAYDPPPSQAILWKFILFGIVRPFEDEVLMKPFICIINNSSICPLPSRVMKKDVM